MQTQSFRVHHDRLGNGLRLVTVELPHLHSASIAAYVRIGSRFESPEDNGLSHFLEHMLFRGTQRLPDAYQLNRAVEELGGTLYAETSRDSSLYQIGLHLETMRPGMLLMGEILRQPVFSQIDVERRIILEELQEDLDQKGRDINLYDLVYGMVYAGHPLGQKITGPVSNVERFNEVDVWRHFKAHYGASNTVLCVCGAVSRDEALSWATEAMTDLPVGQEHPILAPAPVNEGPLRIHRDGDSGTQTSLYLAFSAFGELDPDFPALVVLGRILDDGMSTRLYQRVVNELGLAYYVSAGFDAFVDTGVFELQATAVHATVPELMREMMGILTALRTEEVRPEELQKALRRYRWDLLAACDDPGSMSEWWGRTELYHRPVGLEEKLARVEAVTAADIQRVARRVFQAAHMTLGTVGRMGARVKGELREIVENARTQD